MKKLNKKKVALLTACVISSVANMGFTAEAEDFDEYSGADYVVTATRTQLEKKEVPTTVEVITKEKIEQLGATDVYSALRLASNVDVRSAGMAGHNVIIRGMDTNHSLVLIDGKRQAGEDTSATQNVYALGRLSLSNIERIEIVRGAASAQYGSDALGGVINIITKKGAEQSGSIGVSTGTEEVSNWYHYDTGKQGKFTGSFDARFSDIRERTNSSGGSNINGSVQDFSFNGSYDVGENKTIDVSAGYYNENTHASYADQTGSFMGLADYYKKKDNKEWYNYKRYDYSLGYSGKDDVNNYNIRAFYSKLTKENRQYNNRETLPTVIIPPPMRLMIGVDSMDLEAMMGALYPKFDWDTSRYVMYGVEGHDTAKLSDKHILTFGSEYRKTDIEGTRLGDGGDNVHSVTQNGITKNYSEKSLNTYAAYIQDEWKINDKLFIIPSVRYDHDSSFGGETSPKIGATYSLSNDSRIKANWGKGFKAPTISEMYMNMHRSMGGGVVNTIGNPDLQPEKSTMWDLSFEAEKDNNFGKITYFNNKVSNLISSEVIPGLNDPDNGQYWYHNVNVNKAQINGVELELGRRMNDNWTIKLTSNWLDAKDKADDTRLTGRAKNNSTLQLMYDDNDTDHGVSAILWVDMARNYHYGKSVGSGSSAKTEYHDTNYHTVNFTLNKKFGKDLRVFAGVDNIFDKEITDIALTGRIWRAGAEWTF